MSSCRLPWVEINIVYHVPTTGDEETKKATCMGTYYIVTQDGIYSVGGFERKGISKFAFIVMLIVHTTYMQLQSSTYLHYYSTCTVVCRRRWTGTDDKMRCNEARERERLQSYKLYCKLRFREYKTRQFTGSRCNGRAFVSFSSGAGWLLLLLVILSYKPEFLSALPPKPKSQLRFIANLLFSRLFYYSLANNENDDIHHQTSVTHQSPCHHPLICSYIYLNKSSCGLALVVIPLSVSTNWDFTQISFFNELGFWRPPLPLGLGLESTPPTTGHIYRKMNDGRWRDH